jgi:hypothetical protein
MVPVETIPGMEVGVRGEWWRGWIQVGHIDTLRTFVNATMYPHPAQQFKNRKAHFPILETVCISSF